MLSRLPSKARDGTRNRVSGRLPCRHSSRRIESSFETGGLPRQSRTHALPWWRLPIRVSQAGSRSSRTVRGQPDNRSLASSSRMRRFASSRSRSALSRSRSAPCKARLVSACVSNFRPWSGSRKRSSHPSARSFSPAPRSGSSQLARPAAPARSGLRPAASPPGSASRAGRTADTPAPPCLRRWPACPSRRGGSSTPTPPCTGRPYRRSRNSASSQSGGKGHSSPAYPACCSSLLTVPVANPHERAVSLWEQPHSWRSLRIS